MPRLLLPDTTVLINFATIGRLDLLAHLVRDQGTWCLAIANETQNSEAYHPELATAKTIFGTPLTPTPVEHLDTVILRDSIASPGDPTTKHRGEAETIAIISRRRINGLFLTDDRDAQALATRHGIPFATTWDLLRVAHTANKVTAPALSTYLQTLSAQHRGHPPGVTDPNHLDDWLHHRP